MIEDDAIFLKVSSLIIIKIRSCADYLSCNKMLIFRKHNVNKHSYIYDINWGCISVLYALVHLKKNKNQVLPPFSVDSIYWNVATQRHSCA